MVQELLSRVLKSNPHITLLLLFLLSSSSALSQSVLLPADIVIVSVNSSGDSFDFIPLVKLEKGTSVWFSNGVWDSDSLKISGGESVEVVIQNTIDPGTNIHINEIEDSRVRVHGHIDFKGSGDRILAYQLDEGATRVIYGVGWGNPEVWNAESSLGSEIPGSISKENKSLVQLGLEDNYQYYLRNGASGTPSMLASFVSDPAKWRGRKERVFPPFGTAFRILRPPVVLFDESISTVKEGESIVLNVAIFEHDGSRLTVDAVFNTFNSTADTNDVKKFDTHTFNFTGLIGDAVYAVEIPIEDDETFEGTENAFFELQNISKGELGDFISHVAFIQDNEIPSVQITSISYSGNPNGDFIEIQNNEHIDVDLSGWKFVSRESFYEFGYGDYISAFQNLKILHPKANKPNVESAGWLRRNTGTLELKNEEGVLISNMRYRLNTAKEDILSRQELSSSEMSRVDIRAAEVSGKLSTAGNELQSEDELKKAGWYTLTDEEIISQSSAERKIYNWNEATQSFEPFDSYSGAETSGKVYITYFEEEELVPENASQVDSLETEVDIEDFIEQPLLLSITATDFDENGVINGAEGFNFLRNTTSNPMLVKDLISTLNEELFNGAIYPYVFLWEEDGKGWMSASKLIETDVIPAQRSFWIRADSLFEPFEYTLNVAPFVNSEAVELEEAKESGSELSISLKTEELHRDVTLKFFEDKEDLSRDVIAPELEPELKVENSRFLFFGASTGLNWNSEINLELIEDQKLVFPLDFETSESGVFTLLVKNWDNIPVDWKVIIEDRDLGKEYELNQNWTFEFDHLEVRGENEKANEIEPKTTVSEELDNYRFNLIIIPPGVSESQSLIPEEVSLNQNYPNPFNPSTTISFYLPEAVPVKLSVFNIVGQPVAVLTDGTLSPGDHEFEWDATGLPSGMYIYQLEVGNKVMTRKMTLVK